MEQFLITHRFISIMSLEMSSKMTSKLYTDKEIGFERVIEIRIRDLKTNKQKSFSLSSKSNNKDYPNIEKVKNFLEKEVKNLR
jgi:hypothetical protein